jgi:hypothetical protein
MRQNVREECIMIKQFFVSCAAMSLAVIAISTFTSPVFTASAATTCTEFKVRLSNQTAKDAATDIPSWAAGERPCKVPNEDGKGFATRLLTAKYGAGNYPVGAGSEYSKIQKFGDRAF